LAAVNTTNRLASIVAVNLPRCDAVPSAKPSMRLPDTESLSGTVTVLPSADRNVRDSSDSICMTWFSL